MNNSSQKKEQLLKMAKNGEPKPKRDSKLYYNFCSYIGKTFSSYDENFEKKIIDVNPNWIKRRTPINEKKEELIKIAKSGKDKPKSNSSLGYTLNLLTNPNKKYNKYDENFYKEIFSIRPEWFGYHWDIDQVKEYMNKHNIKGRTSWYKHYDEYKPKFIIKNVWTKFGMLKKEFFNYILDDAESNLVRRNRSMKEHLSIEEVAQYIKKYEIISAKDWFEHYDEFLPKKITKAVWLYFNMTQKEFWNYIKEK